MSEGKAKGYGIISVSPDLMPHLLDIANAMLQGDLRADGTSEDWHQRLLLPETYTVLSVHFDHLHRCWNIHVESEDIPAFGKQISAKLPKVTPVYSKDERGIVSLVEIKIDGVTVLSNT